MTLPQVDPDDDRAPGNGHLAPSRAGELERLRGRLEELAAMIDQWWSESLSSGAGGVTVRLGDASHGLHRALIALADDPAGSRGQAASTN